MPHPEYAPADRAALNGLIDAVDRASPEVSSHMAGFLMGLREGLDDRREAMPKPKDERTSTGEVCSAMAPLSAAEIESAQGVIRGIEAEAAAQSRGEWRTYLHALAAEMWSEFVGSAVEGSDDPIQPEDDRASVRRRVLAVLEAEAASQDGKLAAYWRTLEGAVLRRMNPDLADVEGDIDRAAVSERA